MYMKLDFSALSAPVTRAEVDEYRLTTEGKKKLSFTPYLIAIWIFAPLVCGFTWIASGGEIPLWILLLIFSVISLVAYGGYKGTLIGYRQTVRLNRLAVANGLRFKHEDKDISGYAGMIFTSGHSKVIKNALISVDETEIGNFTYVTGSGKNRSTHNYGYVKVKLPRRLPHMVLDSKHNNFWAFSNLPATFDKSQVLSLEGDFNNYYTLYAPKQYERDALYVFTPDVMAAFVDAGAKYDAEVIDDSLYIYHVIHFRLDSEEELLSLQKIVNAIGGELKQQTRRYQDERAASTESNVVAAQGARLKKGVNYIVIAIAATIFIYQAASSFMPEGVQAVVSLALSTAIWGGVGYGIYRSIKRNRR